MNVMERNRRIYEIRKAHPDWTYQDIGDLVGLTRQRVQQIIQECQQNGTMEPMRAPESLDNRPVSVTEAAKLTGIPHGTICAWIFHREVEILERPTTHAGPGKHVMLDPVSLRNRIARYKPRPRKSQVSA